MTAADVKRIRAALGMTQETLARLLGVHGLTVSKWERGVSTVSPWQAGLLAVFEQATVQEPSVGRWASETLAGEGAPAALHTLFDVVFGG